VVVVVALLLLLLLVVVVVVAVALVVMVVVLAAMTPARKQSNLTQDLDWKGPVFLTATKFYLCQTDVKEKACEYICTGFGWFQT
jgi:flagellar basal body-associated protein FliL